MRVRIFSVHNILDVQATRLNDELCALWRTIMEAKINRQGEVVLVYLWPKQVPNSQ